MPKSSFLIRFAIVGIFGVFALGFLLPPSQAQPGPRPPGFPPPPVIPPRPPVGFGGAPGGIAGTPGGITGVPGGISGMPGGRPPGAFTGTPGGATGISGAGISGIHGTGISGIHGAGISGISGMGGPGFGGGGRTETVWTCSRCGFELGRGPVDPGQPSCPRCGVKFNGSSGPGAVGAIPSTPPISPPTAAPSGAPELPINPFAGGRPAPSASSSEPTASSSDSSASSSEEQPSGRSRTIKLIGIVCGAIFLIGAIAVLGVVLAMNASASKPTRRPSRRAFEID
jgi:hypothetical protein